MFLGFSVSGVTKAEGVLTVLSEPFLETVRGMSDFLCRIKDRKTTGEEFALWKF